MSETVEEHDGKFSTRRKTSKCTNLQFVHDGHANAEEEQELEALVESLKKLHKV